MGETDLLSVYSLIPYTWFLPQKSADPQFSNETGLIEKSPTKKNSFSSKQVFRLSNSIYCNPDPNYMGI